MKMFLIVVALLATGSSVSAQGREDKIDMTENVKARAHILFNQNRVAIVGDLEKKGIRAEISLDDTLDNRCTVPDAINGYPDGFDNPPIHVLYVGKTDGKTTEGSFCFRNHQLYSFGW